MKTKLNFDDALERINDGRRVDSGEVQAKALTRKVWVAEWHIPGCMSEAFSVLTTKADAIDCAIGFTGADDSSAINHAARGIRTALRKHGSFQHCTEMYGTVVSTVRRERLGDLL